MDRNAPELKSVWSDVEGRKVHTRVSTSIEHDRRPPVVLVHGLIVSGLYLVPVGELLAQDFHVYAPDFPGFGHSEKPEGFHTVEQLAEWLIKYLDATGLECPAFLANSMGCQVVVEAAVRYPERFRNIVLSAPVIDRHARNTPTQIWRTIRDYPHERQPIMGVHIHDYFYAGLRRSIRSLQSMMSYRIEDRLPHIPDPVLVVRGENDPIVPQRWAEEVTRLLPQGRLVVIPGGAHATNFSSPLELARVSRPFLARADGTNNNHRHPYSQK